MFLRAIVIFLVVALFTLKSNGQKFAFVDSEYILEQMEGYQKAQEETRNVLANNKIVVSVKTIANKNMIGVIISIYKPFSNYISKPIKPRKAKPIKPVIKNAIPTPLRGPGILAYLILSLIAAISTTAINHPTPDPNP